MAEDELIVKDNDGKLAELELDPWHEFKKGINTIIESFGDLFNG